MSNSRNERDLLNDIGLAFSALGMNEGPEDLRDSLPTNPLGASFKIRDVHRIKGMVWHQALGDSSVEGVASYHTGPNSHLHKGGTMRIAYTWAIRANGSIVLCNDLDLAPWSQGTRSRAGDENAEFMSVMMQGLFHGPHVTGSGAHEPSHEQILAAIVLWRVCAVAWRWDEEALFGHYHFGKAACPGYAGQEIIEVLRRCPSSLRQTADYSLSSAKSRQQALERLGYAITPDGIWGALSRMALMQFQTAEGLEPDGIWGPATEREIIAGLESR